MKTLKEIKTIIANTNEETLDVIFNAWYDMIVENGNVRRNARRRFLYNIKKIGLTEAEYDMWEEND